MIRASVSRSSTTPVSRVTSSSRRRQKPTRPAQRLLSRSASVRSRTPPTLPAAKMASGISTGAQDCSPEKYPNCTASVCGVSPSERSRKTETVSVFFRVSLGTRRAEPGAISSIFSRSFSAKSTIICAGSSESRITRSRFSRYKGKIARWRTSPNDSVIR